MKDGLYRVCNSHRYSHCAMNLTDQQAEAIAEKMTGEIHGKAMNETPKTDAWSQRLQRAWSDWTKGSLFTDTVLPALDAIESEVRTLESERAASERKVTYLTERLELGTRFDHQGSARTYMGRAPEEWHAIESERDALEAEVEALRKGEQAAERRAGIWMRLYARGKLIREVNAAYAAEDARSP